MNPRTALFAALFCLSSLPAFSQEIIDIYFDDSYVNESGGSNQTTCTITLDTIVGSNTNLYVVPSDTDEISVPSPVVVTTGNDSVTFVVSALPDGVFDLNALVELGVSFTDKTYDDAEKFSNAFVDPLIVLNVDPPPAPVKLVISQYYEGIETDDDYIEITNLTGANISLNRYALAVYLDSEGWKDDDASPSFVQILDSLVVPANGVLLLKNQNAILPAYASATATSAPDLSITGPDSVVLYSSNSSFIADNIVDVISLTSNGEGQDTSFIRLLNNATGFDTQPGSEITQYGAVWQQVDLADVDSANSTDSEYLGFSLAGGGPNLNTFTGYIASFGLTGSNATPTANPDGDAFTNIYEYAFDLDPTTAQFGRLLGYSGQTTGNYSITLAFTRDADKTDLDYLVKRAPSPVDLANNTANETTIADSQNGNATVAGPNTSVIESPASGNKYNVNVTYNGSTSTSPRQFFEVEPSL